MSVWSPHDMGRWEKGDVNGSAGALWLAKKEIKRAWLSYVLTGFFVLLLGFFAVPSVSGVFEFEGFGAVGRRMEDFYNAFFADYLFLLICAFLPFRRLSHGVSGPSRMDS